MLAVLYQNRPIVRTKPDYYRRLQAVREQDGWEEWIVYMLTAVEETAHQTLGMAGAMQDYSLTDVTQRLSLGEKNPTLPEG